MMAIHPWYVRRRSPSLLTVFLLCVPLLFFGKRLYAELPEEIREIYPLPHQSIDTLTTTVRIVFNEDTPQINDQNFIVYGNQTGLYPGAVTYESDTRTATFVPSIPYKVGEKITSILTSEIIPGNPGGFMWTFYSSPYAGTGLPTGTLTLSGVNLPYALAPGDFNGDGYLDLVSANLTSHRLAIFLAKQCQNSSWPGFDPPEYLPTGLNPTDVLALDVDCNGTLDLIASHYLSRTLSVHLNDGTGIFSAPLTIDLGMVNPSAIEAAEFTGDKFVDLVVAGLNSVISLANDGDGGFTVIGPQLASGKTSPGYDQIASGTEDLMDVLFPFSIATGDVDNDGYVELFLGSFTEAVIRKYTHGRNQPYFTEVTSDSIPLPYSPLQIALADLECSTPPNLDLIAATEGFPDQFLRTFLNDGEGRFPLQHQAYQEDLPQTLSFYIANLDPQADGTRKDLDVMLNHLLNHRLLFYTNNCGTFTSADFTPTGIGPRDVTGGDFNQDGAIDIAVPNSQNNNIHLYISNLPPEKTLTINPSSLDFGTVSLCDADTAGLWIKNENLFPVLIASIDVVDGTFFRIDSTSYIPTTLNSGDSVDVTLIFQPGLTGQFSDSLHLSIDNCNVFVEDVPLSGIGSNPLIASPEPLDFGPVKLCGGHQERELVITSGSRNPVRVLDAQVDYIDSIFTIASIDPTPPVDLDQGDTLKIIVRYEPVAPGEDVGSIRFDMENCSGDTQETELRGEGDSYTFSATPDPIYMPDTVVDSVGGPVRVTLENLNNNAGIPIRTYLKGGLPVFFMNMSCTTADTGGVILIELAPGGTADLCVFFNPPDQILYTDTLIIEPQDQNACPGDVQRIPILGLGLLNDPPVWTDFPRPEDLRYYEGELMDHTLYADDPDGDELLPFVEGVCSDPSLPEPLTTSVCPPLGDLEGCLNFSWIAPQVPNYLDSIVYHPRFIVRETGTPEMYADTLCLDITVFQRLPDLQIVSLSSNQNQYIVNRSLRVRCQITSINQSVEESFVLRMTTDEGEVEEWTIPGLTEGEVAPFDTAFTFGALGNHWIEAFVDAGSAILEESESNNRDTLWLNIEEGDLIIRHNPFTPNGDGYNDRLEFDLVELNPANPQLFIFSIDGRRIATISRADGYLMHWDGKDQDGRAVRPGAYLYVIKDGSRGIASGTIGLVR